ncbi:MAG TPA: tetratricopeptide repeat protein, partial [Myxococcaceae bacterium]
MQRLFGWMAVLLCCAAEAGTSDAGADARLVEAQAAFDEARRLLDAGRYADGLPHGDHALALREAALGENHPDVASYLDMAGELHRRSGDYARAETLLQRGLALREKALGKDHPDVASSLNNLAELYRRAELFARAEPMYLRALAIHEAALGKDHPDVATSLNGLARIYWRQGSYGRAELLAQR